MTEWQIAANELERLLEFAGSLVDGEPTAVHEPVPSLPVFDLSEPPNAATRSRIIELLEQTEQALAALDCSRQAVRRELDHLSRHRPAAAAYVRATATRFD